MVESMDFPSLDTLRARSTRKWSVYDPDVIPLWIAESDFPTAPVIKDRLAQLVDAEAFGYTPAPKASGLPGAVADFYEQRFGWRPDPRHVVWIGDVVRGLALGIEYFTRPGSPVIVPQPTYPPFLELPAATGRELVTVAAERTTGLDFAAVERALADGAGSILLCNPHNPLGFVFSREQLSRLVELAMRYDARILSDEIHAPLVYDGPFIPVASLGDEAARCTITVTATSKAFNVAGLKCAQILFSNPADAQRWKELTGVAKDGTGTLGVFAAETAYKHGGDFLDEQVAYLSDTRHWLADALRAAVPGLHVEVPAATYLMWLDFSETALGGIDTPAAWLCEHARVALNEGTAFGQGGAHHARLNFATSPDNLRAAVDRIAAAVRHA